MATQTTNKLVEILDNNLKRETPSNGQALETENARFDQVGLFRRDNVAASLTNSDLTLGAVDAAAPLVQVAGRAGTIVGVCWNLNAALTAGVATIQPTIAGTEVGVAASLRSAQSAVVNLATPVPFDEAAQLGLSITTDGSLAPTTAELYAWLLVRWAA